MLSMMQQGLRLFHPTRHVWLCVTPKLASISVPTKSYEVEIGLTERGLEDIGDMTMMRAMVPEKTAIHSGHELLQVEWEGHSITSADELYHTVWETFTGITTIKSPVPGIVEQVNIVPSNMCIDDDTILVKMSVTEKDWESAKLEMMKEAEYLKLLRKVPPGKFSEKED